MNPQTWKTRKLQIPVFHLTSVRGTTRGNLFRIFFCTEATIVFLFRFCCAYTHPLSWRCVIAENVFFSGCLPAGRSVFAKLRINLGSFANTKVAKVIWTRPRAVEGVPFWALGPGLMLYPVALWPQETTFKRGFPNRLSRDKAWKHPSRLALQRFQVLTKRAKRPSSLWGLYPPATSQGQTQTCGRSACTDKGNQTVFAPPRSQKLLGAMRLPLSRSHCFRAASVPTKNISVLLGRCSFPDPRLKGKTLATNLF